MLNLGRGISQKAMEKLMESHVILTGHKCTNPVYTWVERGTVRVKCLAQEHNMSRARDRSQMLQR